MNTSKFSIPDLLLKKGRDKKALSKEEIEYFIDCVTEFEKRRGGLGVLSDENLPIQEAQIGAMLMAIFIQKLNEDETEHLTRAMIKSGKTLEEIFPVKWKDWKEKGILVDKHSTGGVGDKTSLVLAPVLADLGLIVPMISGRGLEHTGGTLDKLESIPGFKVSLSHDEMIKVLTHVGCCIVGQTSDIVPADKILYKLRDATSTVMELGLITGSIISKKAVESLNALVLDVKYGKGAFCKTKEEAEELATKMEKAGERNGIETKAFLNDMNSPLGYKIGNTLEVAEAIQCLHGEGPTDLTNLVKRLGGHLLVSAKKARNIDVAYGMITDSLQKGTAIKKFAAMLTAQGVDKEMACTLCQKGTDVFEILTKSKDSTKLKAKASGYVHGIDALKCGEISRDLGANRRKAGDNIVHEVGLTLAVNVGDRVVEGLTTWVTVHHNQELTPYLIEELEKAIDIKPHKL